MLKSPSQQGFSLLELLVVVVIIGILATMFTLSVGVLGADSELERETERLQALLNLAREDAVTQGRELGMHFYPNGYEFAIYEEDFVEYYDPDDAEARDRSEWLVFGNGALLRPRTLPDGIVIELEIDGREIILDKAAERRPVTDADESTDQDEADAYRPQIRFYSSGDLSPFVIRFRREFESAGLIMDFADDGSVELTKG